MTILLDTPLSRGRHLVAWSAVFGFALISSAIAVTNDDLATASPVDLLIGIQAACSDKSQEKLFDWHTRRIRKTLLDVDDKEKLMSFYCGQLPELIRRLGGNPKAGRYFIRPNPDNPNKSELCMSTPAKPDKCDMSFDVAIEDGRLKKDEL
jgi:hypothetical protein